MRSNKQCNACRERLAPGEGPSYCRPCRRVLARIDGDGAWVRLLPAEEQARRAAALAVQEERIRRELASRAG